MLGSLGLLGVKGNWFQAPLSVIETDSVRRSDPLRVENDSGNLFRPTHDIGSPSVLDQALA